MYDEATAEDTRAGTESLWVVIAVHARSYCFELDGQIRHSVAIGSSPCADLRIEHAHDVPVECNLERDEDDIWLIPGWPTNFIRVDGMVIERPTRLWRRCGVEIEGIRFDIRIREEPPTFPDCGIPNAEGKCAVSETIGVGQSGPDVRYDLGQSWADGFEGVPSSTAAFASTVTNSGDAWISLERLGILTKRRPLSVALGATLGAVVIATGMHLSLEMLGSHSALAAPLQHITRACVPSDPSSNVSTSAAAKPSSCDLAGHWLQRVWPRTLPTLDGVRSSSSLGRSVSPDRCR